MGLLNYVFLIHGLVETAVGLIYLFLTENVPVTSLDQPTTLWSLKFFGATMLSLSIPALLCSSLPDMLPGKRALAVGLIIFHTALAVMFFQMRGQGVVTVQWSGFSTEIVCCWLHGSMAVLFWAWQQSTAGQVKMYTKQQKKASEKSN